MVRRILFLALITNAFACSHKMGLSDSDTVLIENTIKVSGSVLVDKKRKFNTKMFIENVTDRFLLLQLNSIKCFKGEVQGTIQHAFFGAGERLIDLAPGQMKSFNMLCYFGGRSLPLGSDYRYVFKVWDNPSKDRRTPDKLLVDDGEWVIKFRDY